MFVCRDGNDVYPESGEGGGWVTYDAGAAGFLDTVGGCVDDEVTPLSRLRRLGAPVEAAGPPAAGTPSVMISILIGRSWFTCKCISVCAKITYCRVWSEMVEGRGALTLIHELPIVLCAGNCRIPWALESDYSHTL